MSDDLTACPGPPQCAEQDDHLHTAHDDEPVVGTGWLVDLVAHPERATVVLAPKRGRGRRR